MTDIRVTIGFDDGASELIAGLANAIKGSAQPQVVAEPAKRAESAKEQKAEKAPEAKQKTSQAKTDNASVDMRAFCKETAIQMVQAGERAALKEMLEQVGVSKVSDLTKEQAASMSDLIAKRAEEEAFGADDVLGA